MRKTLSIAMPAAALVLAGQLFAGGFWLQLGNPEANAEARKANAALLVRATGCIDPADARLTATAIGMVEGRRRSIALRVQPLSEPGTFAIARQWPSEGRWVIELVGSAGQRFTNTLVNAAPGGVDRLHAKAEMKKFDPADIDAMLR